MKIKAIVKETRLIRDANERLPVNERNEAKVKGLYRSAAAEVDHDRKFNPEKYMYMSDGEMAELVKNKFDEKIADLPGMTPDKTEKSEDIELAEDEFADEMGGTPEEISEETPQDDGLGDIMGDAEVDDIMGDMGDAELDDIMGDMGETTDEEPTDEEDSVENMFGDEETPSDESEDEDEDSAADKVNED